MTLRAYLVEDSPTIRDNLIEALREMAEAQPVGTAETEHEGRRWLTQNADGWDIAIVDLFLREGSGLNVIEALQNARRPGQRVVVLSNHSSRDVKWRCEQLGADAVFDKSTEIEALVAFCTATARSTLPRTASAAVAA
ncbi:response regulator [Ramlibacter sp.]|uniref:response regulator n=1 Tax=Ramlibacter sp. TaxID=1917967 RepID=UPI003D0AEC99